MTCYVCSPAPLKISGSPGAIQRHLKSEGHLMHMALNYKLSIIAKLKA
jgi:hypothetical protein